MPVLVNPKKCLNRENCFASNACPYNAYIHNSLKRTWEVDATICGDCPGPCVNFCDQDAVLWADDLAELKLVKAELEGTMTHEKVSEARAQHRHELAEARKKQTSEGILALTRGNFEEEVLRSPLPVVVDCWADWCAPCKQFSPIFEAMAKQYAGVVKFTKLDTDAEPALARGLGVQALPTVLMFYKGQLANAAEGALPAAQFQTWIYQTLAAIRQYEAQFAAEEEDSINAAADRMATLNGQPRSGQGEPGQQPPAGSQGTSSSGLILDTGSGTAPSGPRGRSPEDDLPGRQTSSGLFIP